MSLSTCGWSTLAVALSGLDGALIQIFILQNDLACTKLSSGAFSTRLADLFAGIGFLENLEAPICHALGISDFVEKPVDPVSNDFWNASHATGNDRNLARHSLQCNETKRLQLTRQEKDIRNGEKLAHVILLAN